MHDAAKFNEKACEGKVAMLVGVPEFVQNRKRLFGRILPVVKRLQPLQVCTQTWPDSPEALRFFGSNPGDEISEVVHRVGGEVDREADVSPLTPRSVPLSRNHGGRRVPVSERELPEEVVQRGTEVMNDVTNDSAPLQHGRFLNGFGVEDYLACFRVTISSVRVRVVIEERLDPLVEEAQVHIRPLDLEPASVQRVAHD